ncbi:hypothetical protein E2493_13060 [Sphingomonas parva]|uniref:Uncharacterized protein n=1 Tax=Sphingomonas parva TaxID=2555898 RepID=A0A4Y8ZRS3_9SPHN|nr:hypothetical protein [Sphingomonas parva]TFI57825.1 hypothetical protein E2493_13060 [Sphingomonas parva]
MLDLLKAEWLRFRALAATVALLHLGVIAFYGRMVDLLQQPPMIVQAVAAAYALAGLLLGLYQMGSYRRPNRWLNLLHRPLPPARIALALAGAGALLLTVALVLPMLIMLAGQEWMSARVVDVRHWLLPLAALLSAMAGYLAGAYAMVGVRRYAPLVLILPAMLPFSNAVGIGAIAIQVLVVAWLLYLLVTAFRPDPGRIPERPLPLILTALPVQLALYLVLLTAGDILFQLGWIMSGTHPLNSVPPRGGLVEASRAEGPDLVVAGLAASRSPEAPLWREQVSISDAFRIQPGFDQLPVRGELTNSVPIEFEDEEHQVHWTFSHDSMRFEGRGTIDGAPRGSLGLGESGARFQRPPVSLGEGVMVDAGRLVRFDPEIGRIVRRLALPAGETIAAAPVPVGDAVAILSDKALYLYDAQVLEEGDAAFPARWRAPLPGPIGDLERADIVELLDAHLVSFAYGRGNPDGAAAPFQTILRVDSQGRAIAVGARPLKSDFPLLSRFRDRWLSPAMNMVRHAMLNLFAPRTPLTAAASAPTPPSIWALALALCLGSLTAAWWWTRRVALPGRERVGWTLAAGAIGLPALISLWLFHPRRQAE